MRELRERPAHPSHPLFSPTILTAIAVTLGTGTSIFGAPLSAQQPMSEGSNGIGTHTEEVTFSRDVAPILQANCQICHRPGSVGPMSLLTYQDTRRWASRMKDLVSKRLMPPYHLDTGVGIQEIKDDWRLSDEEIGTVVAWADAGAPEGNP